MSTWSRLLVPDEAQMNKLVAEARTFVGRGPDGCGVFRARGSLVLYLSPVATTVLRSTTKLPLDACGRPDGMLVEIVAGPEDDPLWYDMSPQAMTDDLDIAMFDDMGLITPDFDLDELRRVHGRGAAA